MIMNDTYTCQQCSVEFPADMLNEGEEPILCPDCYAESADEDMEEK